MIARFRRLLRQLRAPAVTRIILGESSRQHGYGIPIVSPEFKSFVVKPDGYEFGFIHDGFEDDREPSQVDERETVHRWNTVPFLLLIAIAVAIALIGGK